MLIEQRARTQRIFFSKGVGGPSDNFVYGGGGVQSGLLLVILLYGFYKAGFSSRVLILSLLDPRME